MLHSILIRVAGLAAIAGGAAAATLGLLHVLQATGVTLGSIERTLQRGDYENPILTMLLVGVLAAIAVLHVLQRRHYGLLGALASLAAFVGLAMILAGNLLGELAPAEAPVAISFLIVGMVTASVGVVGFGILTIRARVLPRWCGAALVAGSPPFVGLAFMLLGALEAFLDSIGLPSVVPGGISSGGLWVLLGVPWALVGYALFRVEGQRPRQHSRVR